MPRITRDTIGVGFLGAGDISILHAKAVAKVPGAKLVGLWNRSQDRAIARAADFGCKNYATPEDLVNDPAIDAVFVLTNLESHLDYTKLALNAGKHVLVEKAIALTTADADAMLAAAAKSGKLLMVAHVLPYFPEFAFAAEAVRGGRYGKLLGAHLTRVISRPDWSADIGDAAKTGGPAVDLHVHDTHFIGLICGVPQEVFSTGIVEGDAVNYLTTQYLYGPGGPVVSCSSGAVATSGRPFAHGYELFLEGATLAYHSGGVPLTVFTPDGQSFAPQLDGGGDPISAFTAEIQAAVEGVVTGKVPDLLSAKLARDALTMCHRECESVKLGRPVRVD